MTTTLDGWLNRIHEGDCLALMRQLPDESVDLIVTSPPYNLGRSTGGGVATMTPYCDCQGFTDNLPRAEYIAWQRECLTEMMRLLKPDGAIYWNHKNRVQNGIMETPLEILAGFPVRQMITWQRDGGINHNPGYYLPNDEQIYLIAKPGFRPARNHGLGTVWHMALDRNPGHNHPRPFPLELPRRAISSTDAQVVLDPFMGSGTTAVAARQLRRHYIGMELCGHYCEQARRRIDNYRGEEPRSVEQRVQRGMVIKSDYDGKVEGLTSLQSSLYRAIADKCRPLGDAIFVQLADLAAEVGVERTTVSKMLKRLGDAGLISRQQSRHGIVVKCLVDPWAAAGGVAVSEISPRNADPAPRRANPGTENANPNANPAPRHANPGGENANPNANPAPRHANPGVENANPNANPAPRHANPAPRHANPGAENANPNANPARVPGPGRERKDESLTGPGPGPPADDESVVPPCSRCGPGTMRPTKWPEVVAVTEHYGGLLYHCSGQNQRCSFCWHIEVGIVVEPGQKELNQGRLAARLRGMLQGDAPAEGAPADAVRGSEPEFLATPEWAACVADFEACHGRAYRHEDMGWAMRRWKDQYDSGVIATRPPF